MILVDISPLPFIDIPVPADIYDCTSESAYCVIVVAISPEPERVIPVPAER